MAQLENIVLSNPTNSEIEKVFRNVIAVNTEMEQKADKNKTITRQNGVFLTNKTLLDYLKTQHNNGNVFGSVFASGGSDMMGLVGFVTWKSDTTNTGSIFVFLENINDGKLYYRRFYSETNWIDANWQTIATTDKVDISSTLINNWVSMGTSLPFTVARSGNIVTVNGWIKNGTLTKSLPIATVPNDCIPSSTRHLITKKYNSNDTFVTIIDIDGKIKQDNNIAWTAGDSFYINGSYSL